MNKEEIANKISNFAEDIWKHSETFSYSDGSSDVPHYVEVNKIFEIVDKHNAISNNKIEKIKEYYKEHNLLDKSTYTCEEVFAYYQFEDILSIIDGSDE